MERIIQLDEWEIKHNKTGAKLFDLKVGEWIVDNETHERWQVVKIWRYFFQVKDRHGHRNSYPKADYRADFVRRVINGKG